MAKKQFKAESRKLLDLMINSIYTHKEIFLREIISNSSDAIDKLCYLSLTDDSLGLSRADFSIRITPDKDNRTITVSDNGVGMTQEELESSLGIIAHSGSERFSSDMDKEKAEDIDIIGRFGVGFYSAFMVADKVTVITKSYNSPQAYKWESTGADGYTVTECEKDGVGTDVIIHIKDNTDDERYSEYLETWRIKELIKKYSDYIRWPIRMDVETTKAHETEEKDENGEAKIGYETIIEEQTVNSMIPIWQRSKSEAGDADCIAFYKEKFFDTEDPAAIIRINAEGMTSYKALLFVPAHAPYDYYTRDYEPGLQLYSSGVLIMDRCAELLPDCFRFVRGVVDSPDLSLNISRELLQHDRQLKTIAKNVEKRVKEELRKLMDADREKYMKFYNSFNLQLKYGIISDYGMKKELLEDLLMYRSSAAEDLIPLRDYVSTMPASQKYIYFACASSVKMAEALPQCEQVRDAGFSILWMTDEVDELVIRMLGKYSEKEFRNVASDDLELETDAQKQETEEKAAQSKELLDFVKEALGGAVSKVQLSHKLKSFPVCITTEGEVTFEMEKYFSQLPGVPESERIKATRVLELNPSHAAFEALSAAFASDKERAEKLSRILLAQAQLAAGLPIDDTAAYSELVCSLF